MDKTQTGLAGEFYVLAQLAHRGFVGTMTLGNTKGVDILVSNTDLNVLYKVEVKTTSQSPRLERLFGDSKFLIWAMAKKHESISDPKLVYCFVALGDPVEMPRFFLVKSCEVSEYVKRQHEHWLRTRTKPVKDTSIRNFRIGVSDPSKYENNWSIFEK